MAKHNPTKLSYFEEMNVLQSTAIFLSFEQVDGRLAMILDSTIFHPQGGGQPADKGVVFCSGFRFVVEDARSNDGVVFHFGYIDHSQTSCETNLKERQEVTLQVDAQRRDLNSRIHSAGHLLDICMQNVGLSHLKPGKGYHFPDGPFVEYIGLISPDQLQIKQKELEEEANSLISIGGKVSASVLPYDEAVRWCNGDLPSYILKVINILSTLRLHNSQTYHYLMATQLPLGLWPAIPSRPWERLEQKPVRLGGLALSYISNITAQNPHRKPWLFQQGSTPRIVRLGNNAGCPCGGTHVADISDIKNFKITQIRSKKGITKVSYSINP